MERLTIPDVRVSEHTTRRTMIDGEAVREHAMDFYWRLKAYEDTWDYGIDIERMKELARADRAGRLVVLPCKVGDTVWVNGTKLTVQVTIDEAYFDDDQKGLQYLVSFDCGLNCDGEWGQASIMGADFGKTIFLTREEAEEALRRAENG